MKHVLLSFSALALALFSTSCGGDSDDTEEDTGVEDSGSSTDPDGSETEEDVTQDTGPPPGEQLWISYTREVTYPSPDLPDGIQLVVIDEDCRPDDCDDPIVVEGDDPAFSCDRGCAPSGDLGFVVFMDPTTSGTMRAVALDDDFQLDGSSWIISPDVRDFKIAGNTIVYKAGTALHAYDLATQTDTSLGTLGDGAGFDLSASGTSVFVGEVTSLSSMRVSELPITGGELTEIYHFIAGAEGVTGSFYSGNEQMALSPDGQFLIVATDAYTAANECGSNGDCIEAGQTCLTDGAPSRCVRQELVFNVVNLAEQAKLNEPCTTDAECGEGHLCDLTIPESEVCMPGRIVAGPAGPRSCDSLALGQYDDLLSHLRWRSDNEIIALMSQDCISGNIDAVGLVAFNVLTGESSILVENLGESHGGDECYDTVEHVYNDELCAVDIKNMSISPSHGTLAFVANSVTSRTSDEVWILDAFGRRDREMMTSSIDFNALKVWAHTR